MNNLHPTFEKILRDFQAQAARPDALKAVRLDGEKSFKQQISQPELRTPISHARAE